MQGWPSYDTDETVYEEVVRALVRLTLEEDPTSIRALGETYRMLNMRVSRFLDRGDDPGLIELSVEMKKKLEQAFNYRVGDDVMTCEGPTGWVQQAERLMEIVELKGEPVTEEDARQFEEAFQTGRFDVPTGIIASGADGKKKSSLPRHACLRTLKVKCTCILIVNTSYVDRMCLCA